MDTPKVVTWSEGDMCLVMWPTKVPDCRKNGNPYWAYKFKHEGKTIFEGKEYGPAPSYNRQQMIADLLGWLALRPGDCDPEYFETYTPEQLRWVSAHAEELNLYSIELSERENTQDEGN